MGFGGIHSFTHSSIRSRTQGDLAGRCLQLAGLMNTASGEGALPQGRGPCRRSCGDGPLRGTFPAPLGSVSGIRKSLVQFLSSELFSVSDLSKSDFLNLIYPEMFFFKLAFTLKRKRKWKGK